MRSMHTRPGLLLVGALAASAASLPRTAHAVGSGSGGAAAFEAIGLVFGAFAVAGLTVLTVIDVKAAADKDRVSTESAATHAGVGVGIAALMFGASASNEKGALPPFVVPLTAAFGAFGGFGVGSLATSRPQWWLFSGAAGITTMAAAQASLSLGGKLHFRSTSIAQAITAAPGLAAGLYGALSSDWTQREHTAGWVLAGASALTIVHGVLDAALKDEPANWNGEPPQAPRAAPTIQVAPQAVSDGRSVVPGFGVAGVF